MRQLDYNRLVRMHAEGMSKEDITAQFRGRYTEEEVDKFIPKPKRGRPKKVETDDE